MLILGTFVHQIDPIILTVGGAHLWWYGLSYTLGFLNLHLHLRRHGGRLNLSPRSIGILSLMVVLGVLLGGRLVEVAFYEWPFYREHPALIPACWIGGMATHGLLLGGLAGIWIFSRMERRGFLSLTDALAVPAAFIMGLGRIGNFIDGQIVGSVTTVAWAVQFPDAEGFRHPVVLYDGLKNLLIIPVLWWLMRRRRADGVITGAFLLLYAGLRIFVDVFREYPTSLLGLATGQTLNLAMSAGGALLLWLVRGRPLAPAEPEVRAPATGEGKAPSRAVSMIFAALLVFCLLIPSDWTQDIPHRYGARHPGLEHSRMYPAIEG